MNLLLTMHPEQNFQFYNLVFQQASIGMCLLSLDGRFLQVNEQMCAILGYEQKELLNMSLRDVINTGETDAIYAFLNRHALASRSPYVLERKGIRKDKTPFWIKITTTVLRDQADEAIGFLSLVEDITERRQVEEESERLLVSERAARSAEAKARQEATALASQLKATFGSMMDGVLMYDLDGKLLQANAAAMKFFSLASEEACLGKTPRELLQGHEVYDMHHRPIPMEQLPVYRLLSGEVPSNKTNSDVIIRMPSGREIYLSVSGSLVQDGDGQMIGVVSVFRDISQRYQEEQRTAWAFNKLAELAETLTHLPEYIDLSSEEDTVYISSYTLTAVGQHLTEMVSRILNCGSVGICSIEPLSEKLHFVGMSGIMPKRVETLKAEVEESILSDYLDPATIACLKTNEVVLRNVVQRPFERRSRASSRLSNLLIAPMLIGEQLVGVFIISKNSSEPPYTQEEISLVKAVAKFTALTVEHWRLLQEWAQARTNELALQEANRRFDTFLSVASHELRTPLTTIKASLQLAIRRLQKLGANEAAGQSVDEAERIEQLLSSAIHRANVQERMISDLLDASRIRANKLELLVKPCNLVEIVREAIEDQRQIATDRVIRLYLPSEENIPIVADADRISQVINNYLSNALKYSSPEEAVEVHLEHAGSELRVSVQDKGPGLSQEEQEHVWDRFYRVERIARQYGSGMGLGLGLHICRTLVMLHRGSVGVCSAPGEGSTFWFSLREQSTSS